jgi:nitrite reductase/ring-hydroxylating ferredoxin subunit
LIAVDRAGGRLVSAASDHVVQVEELDRVDLDLSRVEPRHLATGVELATSRGCLHRCTFCSIIGRESYQARSAGGVIALLGKYDAHFSALFGEGPRAFRVVLFKVEAGVRADVNECPHVHIPYHFSSDVFCVYEIEGRRDLMCAHHTAMFHLDDGHCYDGPCKGERLLAVDVAVEVGAVWIAGTAPCPVTRRPRGVP